MDVLSLIGRSEPLFSNDIDDNQQELTEKVQASRFLVVGGAGSIGRAVCKEIFARNPQALVVVDISENNLVELVRDIRSSIGYIDGEFATFALDAGSHEFAAFIKSQKAFDYVLNLAALKHVRSEKDPFTLMRLIQVNIFNVLSSLEIADAMGSKGFFCVSTDKAANPVSMMGASKRIMEIAINSDHFNTSVSSCRFANVAFSDGSLLDGFRQRLMKFQPIAAPQDVARYFMTEHEAGQLCLLSTLLGQRRELFVPKERKDFQLTTLASIARRFLEDKGLEPVECKTEEEARNAARSFVSQGQWPCYFFKTHTDGEKMFEEFRTNEEQCDEMRFKDIDVIHSPKNATLEKISNFRREIKTLRDAGQWKKEDLLNSFKKVVPEFAHVGTGRSLDQQM